MSHVNTMNYKQSVRGCWLDALSFLNGHHWVTSLLPKNWYFLILFLLRHIFIPPHQCPYQTDRCWFIKMRFWCWFTKMRFWYHLTFDDFHIQILFLQMTFSLLQKEASLSKKKWILSWLVSIDRRGKATDGMFHMI